MARFPDSPGRPPAPRPRPRSLIVLGAGTAAGAVLLAASAVADRTAFGPAAPGPASLTAPAGMVEPDGPDCNVVRVERTAWLMGTLLRATVCAPARDAGLAAIEAAFTAVRDVEARLSTWRADSELSRLNAAEPGAWTELSQSTATLLAEMRRVSTLTGGAFDPAAGAAIDVWDLQGLGRIPAKDEIEAARGRAGPGAWEVDTTALRARRSPGVRLDAGGFGKGAGLRRASAELRTSGLEWSVLDFGGQLVLWSRNPDARWPVAVADPRDRDRPAARLLVGSGSVATTAASERFVDTELGRAGHVVDPRSALPVPAWGSVTVVADDPVTADALSTALFVMGPGEALAWCAKTGAAALLLEPRGARLDVTRSPGLDALASVEPIFDNRKDSRS